MGETLLAKIRIFALDAWKRCIEKASKQKLKKQSKCETFRAKCFFLMILSKEILILKLGALGTVGIFKKSFLPGQALNWGLGHSLRPP